MNIQTPLNQTFAKLCLLALYHRLFSVSEGFVVWIYTVGGIQVAWCITVVCVRLFLCTPIAATLNPFIKGRCLNSQILLAAGDSVNSAIDFVMVGMAIYMVIKLRVSRAAKMKMSVLFALGGLYVSRVCYGTGPDIDSFPVLASLALSRLARRMVPSVCLEPP